MKKRTRAHEAGSIEAGSSISKSFFLLIVSMGQSLASQGEPGAPWASKASQPEHPGHPDRVIRGEIEPARASHERPGRPNRASQGAQGRDRACRAPQVARNCQLDKPGRAISFLTFSHVFQCFSTFLDGFGAFRILFLALETTQGDRYFWRQVLGAAIRHQKKVFFLDVQKKMTGRPKNLWGRPKVFLNVRNICWAPNECFGRPKKNCWTSKPRYSFQILELWEANIGWKPLPVSLMKH